MIKKKPNYNDAFKLEAVRLCEPTAQSIAEVAALLGKKPRKLAMWHAQFGHEGDVEYPGNIITRLEQESDVLRAENKRLQSENAQLKKAFSFSTAALRSGVEGA